MKKNVVFKLLHIHPRGRSFRLIKLKLAAFCLSTEQNRTWPGRLSSVIEHTSSINRTQRKVPVWLCSITEGEPIEQQSYRFSIGYWFGFVRLTTPGILDNIAACEWDRARMSYFRDWIATVHKRSISQWQGHPTTAFCKISVRRSKYCPNVSIPWGRLRIFRWPFHSSTILFRGSLPNNFLRFSEVEFSHFSTCLKLFSFRRKRKPKIFVLENAMERVTRKNSHFRKTLNYILNFRQNNTVSPGNFEKTQCALGRPNRYKLFSAA